MELRCEHCSRSGRYHMSTLVERFGRDLSIIVVRERLATGCPRRQTFNIYELCKARWSDDVLVVLYGEKRARELVEGRGTSAKRMR